MPTEDKTWRADSVDRTEPSGAGTARATAPAIARQILKIPCPHCGERVSFDARQIGTIMDCRGCGMSVALKVPGMESAAPAPAPVVVAVPAAPPDLSGAVATGYIMAFLMPVIGFILGVYLLCKNNSSGAVIILLSIVASAVWVAIFNL